MLQSLGASEGEAAMMQSQTHHPAPTQPARREPGAAATPILIVPGIRGSGPAHWQTHWARTLPGAERLEQTDWARPTLAEWTAALAEALRRRPGAVVVAHSLGCALVAHFARIGGGRNIAAALLVAPADVDGVAGWLGDRHGFAPMPRERLAFPSLVAASRNDPYVSLERARGFAADWGAGFRDLGPVGHVNVESGHGPWPEGTGLLEGVAGLRAELGGLRAGAPAGAVATD